MKGNKIISVDLGTRKSAIAVMSYSNIIKVESVHAYSYVSSSIFLNLAKTFIEDTDFNNLIVEIPRAPRGKERISKEDFNKLNFFVEKFLETAQKINKENPFSIYTSYATNKMGYANFKYNLEQVGWRQKLTGLARPNEKDIFYYIKNLEKNKEIEFSEEALNAIYNNQSRRIFYDIIDAVGLGIAFFKYPTIFEEYNKEDTATNISKPKNSLRKVIGKNLTEEEVNNINDELYRIFCS